MSNTQTSTFTDSALSDKVKQFLSIKNISIHLIKLKKLFNNPFLMPKKIDIRQMIRKVISKALRN